MKQLRQGCSPKPKLASRELIEGKKASELGALFRILSNESRLALLHALVKAGELCVTDLAKEVGMKPQAVSNQLQRLVDRRILSSRRSGTNIYYQVLDPCVVILLDKGLCLMEESKKRG